MKKLLTAAVLMVFLSIITGGQPADASDREPWIYLAQQNQESPAKDNAPEKDSNEIEDDEDYDEDYEDEVTQINDPFYNINGVFYELNDMLYILILKPAAKTYNFLTPEVFRKVVRNFFYNLRFPIRFVNCLLQFKGTKAAQEAGGFLMNTTFGVLGINDIASHYDLKPSPEDLGQTLAHWGLGNGFYIMFPILGPSSLRDSARFIDSYFLDPVGWLQYDELGGYSWRTTMAITAYDKLNELSFQLEDIDALKEAAFDPYIAVRNAYVEYRNKLVEE